MGSSDTLLPSSHKHQANGTNKLLKTATTYYRTLLSTSAVGYTVAVIAFIAVVLFATAYIVVDSLPDVTRLLFTRSYGEPTIFVSLASYRDPQCHKTIKDMYRKAQYPDRIHVGVYQQHGEKEDDCMKDLDLYDYVYLDNIDIQRVHFSDGLGPCDARYHCSLMYTDQDYYFQLDAHTRFAQNWDSTLVDESRNCSIQAGTDKIVLAHYPSEFKVEDDSVAKDAAEITTKFDRGFFNSDGIIQPGASVIRVPDKWCEVPFVAGGFMWGPGQMVLDVPFDPDLPFLFHGEELMYSVRLHAAGYKMFGPRHNTVFHFYNRPTFPKVWVDTPDYYVVSKLSVNKVKRSLMLVDPNSPDAQGPLATYTPPKEAVLDYYTKWKFNTTSKEDSKLDYCGSTPL